MHPVRFVHAADLHLDTAFSGLARDISPHLAAHLHEATFTALDRLVSLCESEKADFLILAGDVWNQEECSLRAQLALRDACEKLERLGIPVFVAHGNHDPLSSRFEKVRLPANVTVFGPTVSAVPVCRPGYGDEILAVVHGISHSGPKETRNLAAWFRRTEDPCPQIGVLHTTLNLGKSSGESPYAPCSPDDLAASGLDYWALGHIHEYGTACREPLAVYPGSIQGLHINEQGPHGCVVVCLEADAQRLPTSKENVIASCAFHPLSSVGWKILEINTEELAAPTEADRESAEHEEHEPADTMADLGRLERLVRQQLAVAAESVWPTCETLVVRVRLTGRTPLDALLRRPSVCRELQDLLREGQESGMVRVWVKDLDVQTLPELDRALAVKREDLLGEILRRADSWRENPSLLSSCAREALEDLYSRGRSRKVLEEPDQTQLAVLLEEAERLCADLLENH